MKTGQVILIAILFLLIGIALSNWYNKSKNVCYNLPTEGSPEDWGRYYWEAIHNIADRIPCSSCREEGSELFSFIHDFINEKTKKPLFDPENYQKWLNKFCEIKEKRNLINNNYGK